LLKERRVDELPLGTAENIFTIARVVGNLSRNGLGGSFEHCGVFD
jgi:hypothetical protein